MNKINFADKVKPGLHFQLEKWLCECHAVVALLEMKLPNLKSKTRIKQLLGYLSLENAP
jgi:hypothetical protein